MKWWTRQFLVCDSVLNTLLSNYASTLEFNPFFLSRVSHLISVFKKIMMKREFIY